jgi:hypothetical protein
MHQKRRSGIKRFASSGAIAFPVTIALLFLMTRLILPGEHDRIVIRMIQNIELQRAIRPRDATGIPASEIPQAIDREPPPTRPISTTEDSTQNPNEETGPDNNFENTRRPRDIDWWAEARRLTHESNEAALRRWSLEQGYERYVSIMQGPLPITEPVQATLFPGQEDATGYMNIYGEMEYKISENCVATTQVMVALDDSDFVQALPMVISCKPPPRQKIMFDRYDRE